MMYKEFRFRLREVKSFANNVLSSLSQVMNQYPLVVQMSTLDIAQSERGYDKQKMSAPSPKKTPSVTMSTESTDDKLAKLRLAELWEHIDKLAQKRFPDDENRQLEASQYVHKMLAADNFARIRAYDEDRKTRKNQETSVTTFFTFLINNLLSDFWRGIEGRKRPNKWLKQQNDPIYLKAYDLLKKEKYPTHEVVEMLVTIEPMRERWKIQEVVSDVSKHCPPLKGEYKDVSLNGEEGEKIQLPYVSLDGQLENLNEQIMLEILDRILNQEIQDKREMPSALDNILTALESNSVISLTEEECSLLKLYYQSGLKQKEIAKALNITASQVNKNIKKVLTRLRKALKKAGLID